MAYGDYAAVADAIRKIIPEPGYDDGSAGPVLLRLSWHVCGTYEKCRGTGGSNGGTMRYHEESSDPENAGLQNGRRFLEPIKQQFPWITYADLYTLAGVVAVEEMGGPKIEWHPGRIDYTDATNVPPHGRLPNGAKGAGHVRDIFDRLSFTDQETVALIGAHTVGRMHANISGFDGPWVSRPTSFDNWFYVTLMSNNWTWEKSPGGKMQWYNTNRTLAMLNTDMALRKDPKYRVWTEKYAANKTLFFEHFAKAMTKLYELGVRRGPSGRAAVNYIDAYNCPFHRVRDEL